MDARKRNLICYPLGTVGRDTVYALVTNYLLTFILFTQALTAAQLAAVSGVMIAARVFDALNDPVMGNIIERTRTKWGKFKPWLLAGCLSTLLVVAAMFNNRFSGWTFVIVFGVLYFCYSIAYTMHDISFWGMIPALSRDSGERDRLTSRATLFAGIGGTLANILIPMLTTGSMAIGGSAGTAYGVLGIATGVLCCLFMTFTLVGVREDRSELEKAAPPVSFRKIWSTIRGNDQLLWACLVLLIQQIGNGVALSGVGSTYIYLEFGYAGGLYSLFTTIGMLPTAFLMIFYPRISGKWGRRRLAKGLAAMAVAGSAVMLLSGLALPRASMAKFAVLCLGYVLFNFGQYGFYLIAMLSILNSVEYNEYMTGNRDEAIIASLRPFFTKLASALTVLVATISYLASGLTGLTNRISEAENLAARGLVTEAEKLSTIAAVISESGTWQVNILLVVMCALPALLIAAAGMVYTGKYKLDEKRYGEIVAELAARKG